MIYYRPDIMLDIHGHILYGIYCTRGAADKLTKFYVPREVTYHHKPSLYWFPNLEEIIADPESPVYETHDGCLYNKRGELLYIPHGKKSLRFYEGITGFDPAVFNGHTNLRDIVTSESDRYVYTNGCLFGSTFRWLYFVSSEVRELVIPESVEHISDCVFENAYEKITVADGNRCFSMKDGVFSGLTWDKKHKVLYVSPDVEEMYLPDGFAIDLRCMRHCHSLKRISFPYESLDELLSLNLKGRIEYTVRFENGDEVTFDPHPISLRKYLTVFLEEKVDVRKGTEQIYLDLYFKGKITSPEQKHNFKLSVIQILCHLIDENDTERMTKVLEDNRLVTRRNLRRLIRYAQAAGRDEIKELLIRRTGLPEKTEL